MEIAFPFWDLVGNQTSTSLQESMTLHSTMQMIVADRLPGLTCYRQDLHRSRFTVTGKEGLELLLKIIPKLP